MGRGDVLPLRSLPRIFLEGADPSGPIPLPAPEVDKLRKVLRLGPGAQIAILPNDGTVVRCVFQDREAIPLEILRPEVEPSMFVRIAQALPKPERLENLIRACTEIGVSEFAFFPSDRSVVKWDQKKVEDRLRRLEAIARESAELSFRTRLPQISSLESLASVLAGYPMAIVLSEIEGVQRTLGATGMETTVVIGPEGGWSPREVAAIGDRGVTLGPRVLRVDHAATVAAALLLLNREAMAAPPPSQ